MNLMYIAIGLLVGAGATFAYFHSIGKNRLKKIEESNERKIAAAQRKLAEVENKASQAETKLKEKIVDAKNKAIEIIDEAKQEERKMRQQLEKQE